MAEAAETVALTLADGSGAYTPGATWTATADIADNETPVVSVAWGYDAFEGWSGLLTFTRLGDTSQPLTVNYLPGGTATPDVDYTSIGTSVTFAAGADSVDLEVAALTDGILDNDETVIATIQNASGYIVGAANAATLQIIDNVNPPVNATPDFDLDVNANGNLTDLVDRAVNYMPGYEGNTPVLSTGTSFNTDAYQGQHMKLILDGIGTNTSEISRVEFEIIAVSQLGGYASNRSSPTDVGLDDYSFRKDQDWKDQLLNNRRIVLVSPSSQETQEGGGMFGGQMEATKTWVNFYAKDYGGSARVVARIWVRDGGPERVVRTIELRVPKDTDGDGLADKWEIEMAERWRVQYGLPEGTYSDAQALKKFDPTNWGVLFGGVQDNEEKDPDGVPQGAKPLHAQKDKGDAHDLVEEYRGYILDGGGLDGTGANGHAGGHIRLDPARKEILVEVDHAATLNNLPDVPGMPAEWQTQNLRLKYILNGASKVFSNADRGAGIYMYYLIDQPGLNIQADDVSDLIKTMNELEENRNSQLKSDFLHVLIINEGLDAGRMPTALSFGRKINAVNIPVDRRGSVLAITDIQNKVPTIGFPVPNLDQFLMTTVAHEITHQLMDVPQGGAFDDREHTKNANGADPERSGSDKACIMYDAPAIQSMELATIRFFGVVQVELSTRTSEGLIP